MRDRSDQTDIYLEGYAGALADLCRLGSPEVAAKLMRDAELCPDTFAGAEVEESDLEELRGAIAASA